MAENPFIGDQLSGGDLKRRRQVLFEMIQPIIPSVRRWWTIVREERSPLWINIMAIVPSFELSNEDIVFSIKSLQYSSFDMIDWGYHNSGRWDCVVQPYAGRDDVNAIQMKEIRPPHVSSCQCFSFSNLLLGTRNKSLEFKSFYF